MTQIGKPASVEFKRILNKIKNRGTQTNPRGQKVKEILLQTLEINPLYPIIDFPDREFHYKYLVGEIAWYLRKDNKLEYIKPFSNFWDNIKNIDGTVNSNYGTLLFGKQLRWVYDSLINDKDSRQAIAFLNQPKFQYENNKDFVCTIYLNFFIRNNKLHMKITIRSNDMVYGFSYDAPFFSFVMQHMYLWLKETKYPELELGTYYHYADNIHYYERHFSLMNKILKEDMKTPPLFVLKKRMFHIEEDGTYILYDDAKEFCDKAYNKALDKNSDQSHKSYYDLMNDSGFFIIDASFDSNSV